MAVKNPDAANESLDALKDKHSRDAEEHRAARSTADKILEARQRKTVTLELEGLDVEFAILMGETRNEIEEIEMEVRDLASKAEDAKEDAELEAAIGMTEDEALAQAEAYRDRFVEILVEHATDDSLDREFWIEAYGRQTAGTIAQRLREKSKRADMTSEELEQFPG